MSKILILGGSGFIGSNLAEYLVSNGQKVVVLSRNNNNENLKSIIDKIKYYKGDLNNTKNIEKILIKEKIDIVIHLISNIVPGTEFKRVISEMDTELISNLKLITKLAENNIKLIFFSTGGAIYGGNKKSLYKENNDTTPLNYYGWLKLTLEKFIEMQSKINNLKYLNIRPSNIYGKNQTLNGMQGIIPVTLGKILNKKNIEIWGDGSITRDYLYIKDLCRAIYLLIKKDAWNNTFNIGYGKGTSINKVLQIIKKVTGENFNIIYTNRRKIDSPHNALDTAKLKKTINWGKLTALEEGIKNTWENINC